MRFLLITTIIYVFNITFAQNIQYGKIYKSAKIFFENGQRIEVKNLELLNNTTVTYDNAITNQQLSEISQIQAKKGTASKGGIICGGACGLFMIVSALGGVFSSYEYEEYNNETNQNETKTEPGLSAGEVIVSTAIFAGISYGIGWLSGYIFDDWEVIYANQKLGMSIRDGVDPNFNLIPPGTIKYPSEKIIPESANLTVNSERQHERSSTHEQDLMAIKLSNQKQSNRHFFHECLRKSINHYPLDGAELNKIKMQNGRRPAFFPEMISKDETFKIVRSEQNWASTKLYDDGTHGDDVAGDGLYSRSCVNIGDLIGHGTKTPMDNGTTQYNLSGATLVVVNQNYYKELDKKIFASKSSFDLDQNELFYLYDYLPEWEVAVYPNIIFDGDTFKIVTKQSTVPHCELYDDGTHGDDIAGDGLFSRSGLSTGDLVEFNSRQIFSNKVTKFQFSNTELLVINSNLRGTIQSEDFGDGLFGTEYALFYALGEDYNYVYKRRNWELHSPKNSIAGMKVLRQFGDVFDFLVFVPDKHYGGAGYVRVRDDVRGIMTYGDPRCNTGMWSETDKWSNLSDYKYENVKFGCPDKFLDGNDYPRLKGNIWNGEPGMNGLNHEFGHWMGMGPTFVDFPVKGLSWNSQDRMHINSTLTVSNVMTGPLWDPKKGWPNSVRVKDENGVWKEVQIEESNNDGTFTMVPRNPTKHERYDDILLYMLGFKSPEDANKRYYLFDEKDMNLNDCFYQDDSKGEPLNATAGSSGLYCYDNIIDQSEYGRIVEFGVDDMIDMFGPRVPSYEDAPKHLNVGAIILTKNKPTEAELIWYNLKYEWWANDNEWHDDLGGTWQFVTRGLATITTGIPKGQKINDAIDKQVFEYLPRITDKSLTPELLKSVDGFEVRIEQDERSLNIKKQDMYHDSNYVPYDLYEIDENKPYKLVIYYGDTTNTAFYVNARFDDKFFKPYSFPVGRDGQNISWDKMPHYTIAEYRNPEKNSLLAIDTDDKYDHHALRFDYKKKLQESFRTNGITVLKRHVKNYVYPPQLEFDGSVFITVRTKYFSKHIRLDYGSSATSKGLNNETKH